VIDASNKSFTITVDGRNSLTINLPEGNYASGAALAAAFQGAINGDSVLQSFGVGVTVGWDGSAFTFTSKNQGMASNVLLSGLDGSLAATLGLDAMTSSAGTNVSGMIGGVPAFGNGSTLTASYTSAAKGLVINVLGNVSSATVTVRDTISGMLGDIQKQLTSTSGGLTTTSARLSAEAKRIAEDQAKLDAQSDALKDRLTRQFTAMEKAVSAFKATQSYLQQQIDMWTKSNS
jgi:flagellar hook-associated protein 2